jgi:hypothetical protein
VQLEFTPEKIIWFNTNESAILDELMAGFTNSLEKNFVVPKRAKTNILLIIVLMV